MRAAGPTDSSLSESVSLRMHSNRGFHVWLLCRPGRAGTALILPPTLIRSVRCSAGPRLPGAGLCSLQAARWCIPQVLWACKAGQWLSSPDRRLRPVSVSGQWLTVLWSQQPSALDRLLSFRSSVPPVYPDRGQTEEHRLLVAPVVVTLTAHCCQFVCQRSTL